MGAGEFDDLEYWGGRSVVVRVAEGKCKGAAPRRCRRRGPVLDLGVVIVQGHKGGGEVDRACRGIQGLGNKRWGVADRQESRAAEVVGQALGEGQGVGQVDRGSWWLRGVGDPSKGDNLEMWGRRGGRWGPVS